MTLMTLDYGNYGIFLLMGNAEPEALSSQLPQQVEREEDGQKLLINGPWGLV